MVYGKGYMASSRHTSTVVFKTSAEFSGLGFRDLEPHAEIALNRTVGDLKP